MDSSFKIIILTMKNIYLVSLFSIILSFNASAQKHLIINKLSKDNNLILRNYYNDRLIIEERQDRHNSIELDIEDSDSLVIFKYGYIPVVLLNLNSFPEKELDIVLPKLQKYDAIDTIYTNIEKKRWYSSKRYSKSTTYTPNNWTKINSFPSQVTIKFNSRNYYGELKTKKYETLINGDGKRYSLNTLSIGTEAAYVFDLKE
jgi:hypothetical protein